jgi:hypothetical protein
MMARYKINNMKTLILFLISCNILAQPTSKFTGIVVSKSDSTKIPYVNIRLIDNFIGTFTNSDGLFEINLNDKSNTVQVQISHINYRDTSVLIEKNKTNYIKLIERNINLDEINITAQNPYTIIEATNNKLSFYFPDKELFLKTFYKEIITKDKKASRYSEAFFTVYCPSIYKKNINSNIDINRKIGLIANRTYFEYKDTLVNVCQSPYKILNNVFANVIPHDSSFYNYKIIKSSDDIYVIDVSPKLDKQAVYSYECVINKNDYTIKSIKNYVSDFAFIKHAQYFKIKNPLGTVSIYSKYITEINFVTIGKTTHLASIHNYVKEKFINEKINYSTDIERNSYLFITEEYNKKIKLKNTLKQDDYLHKEKSINETYWDSQNKLTESVNDSILKRQLEQLKILLNN